LLLAALCAQHQVALIINVPDLPTYPFSSVNRHTVLERFTHFLYCDVNQTSV
jgi:hypothetical protein